MLARRILRDDAWKVVAYTLILLGNLIGTIFAYPTFEAKFQTVMSFVPDFLSSLKASLQDAGTGGLSGFLAVNHFFKGVNVVGAAVAVLLASGTIAREVELGTIGMLLSRPRPRARVLATFLGIHLLELIVPLLLLTALVPWLASWLIGRETDLLPLMQAAMHASAFLALIYSIALAFSVFLSEQLKVAAFAGGICVVSFILYLIDQTRDFTLYRLSSIEIYSAIARGEGLVGPTLGVVLGGVCGLCVVIFHRFQRTDY